MSAPAIAVVGAGPSGLFTAQALRRALPDATIDVIDRLPVPFGLLRYGVAPDHQGTKAIARQFERLFERENVGFRGGLDIGRDLTLEALRARYGIVVLATGLAGDRRLAIPGDDLPGIVGSGRFTRWFNDHPDEAAYDPPLGRRVVVVGNGNVALDIARVLARSEGEFAGSDLSPRTLARIASAGIEEIVIVGRGTAEAARFDPALVKEFGRLGETHVRIDAPASGAAPTPVSAALHEIDGGGADAADARRRLTFRFDLTPAAVTRENDALHLRLTPSTGTGPDLTLAADTIITAIGFEAAADTLPRAGWAQADGTLPVCLAPGLYAAGWFRRGPRGKIPDNRAEAKAVADRIVADIAAGDSPAPTGVADLGPPAGAVTYAGWLAIRDQETAAAPAGRLRLKCPTYSEMRAIAAGAQ